MQCKGGKCSCIDHPASACVRVCAGCKMRSFSLSCYMLDSCSLKPEAQNQLVLQRMLAEAGILSGFSHLFIALQRPILQIESVIDPQNHMFMQVSDQTAEQSELLHPGRRDCQPHRLWHSADRQHQSPHRRLPVRSRLCQDHLYT